MSPNTNQTDSLPTKDLTFALIGSEGAMGVAIQRLCEGRPYQIIKVNIGNDEASQKIYASLDDLPKHLQEKIEVVIDFSSPEGCLKAAQWCLHQEIPFVSGTTGLHPDQLDALKAASTKIPVMHAHNYSIGIAALKKSVELIASILPDWDAEIFEAHHRRKLDAPRGTALDLGETIATARGLNSGLVSKISRVGRSGPRAKEEIGYQVLRGGGIIGEHTAFFVSDFERIELTHRASSREIFAAGALQAALWLVQKPANLYTMSDLLDDRLHSI